MGYGFCIKNNPCDEVAIRLGRPPEPVHEAMKQLHPEHFKSEDWDPTEGTFYLRGSGHYTGGYDSQLPCLRGVPPEMFSMVLNTVALMRDAPDVDAEEDAEEEADEGLIMQAIEGFLQPLRAKLSGITKWNGALLDKSQDARQEHAKTYRDGQISILTEIVQELEAFSEEPQPSADDT